MVATASSARTLVVLGSALATVATALLLHPFAPNSTEPVGYADDGVVLTARLPTSKILVGENDQNLVVTITTPAAKLRARPPLSLSIVIDRSGSMNGEPMQNAKAAAARLVARLDAGDAFSIVTYSTGDETVMPMTRATDASKTAAMNAIANIYDDGGTCISCGLTRGANELARSPVLGGVQRIVLISDGQANEGIYDRDELAKLAADTAANGTSISTVGVGLDFDEVTMMRLADVGRGNYYFVEDTRRLDTMFATELSGLAATIASDVRLVIEEPLAAHVEEVYGYPMTRDGNHVVVPIADLRAGETRKVVLHMRVDANSAPGIQTIASVQLGWRRVLDGRNRKALTTADALITDDAAAVAASVDVRAMEAVEQAQTARAFEQASAVYDTEGTAAAQQIIEHRIQTMRANKYLPAPSAAKLEQVGADAQRDFATAPSGGAKAKKATRLKAYDLAK